jgi:pyruvate kinase
MKKIEILCTLGPSSLNERVVNRLEGLGVDLFRLNLSHIRADEVGEMIEWLQKRTRVPVCLDSEGAQIRTGYLVDPHVTLHQNSTVKVPHHPVPGDAHSFNLYPDGVIDAFEVGDYLSIDASVLVQVIGKVADGVEMRVLIGGRIGRNKAATLERDIEMPPLTAKDVEAMRIGRELGIRHVALSFAHRPGDVDQIRALAHPEAFVISKIECLSGLTHLEAIAKRSDAVLIDRGDLSRQVPLERVPLAQKQIIQVAKKVGVPVYVATNLMESMTTEPAPTRAEVNDVFNTMMDGADGLVLAGETAVGKYPIECASMVKKLIQVFTESTEALPEGNGRTVRHDLAESISLLTVPHGGRLVQRIAGDAERGAAERLPTLTLAARELLDLEQIAVGTYSPLTGPMGQEAVRSVLETHRLPCGTVWPMPIVLPLGEAQARALSPGQRVALRDETGRVRCLLDVTEVFSFDFHEGAEEWFGSDAKRDLRVQRLLQGPTHFAAGEVLLVKRLPAGSGQYQLTPAEMRKLLQKKGWNRTLSFHTHSLPHRVHQHIQAEALARAHADGLYVTVETGAVLPGDARPEVILRAYQILLDFGFQPREKLLIGAMATWGRGIGARENVFQALCRKNLGFSHIVLGRADGEAGQATRQLFEALGDLAIEPVYFESLGWHPGQHAYVPETQPGVLPMCSSGIRKALEHGESLPEWFLQSVVQRSLAAETSLLVR